MCTRCEWKRYLTLAEELEYDDGAIFAYELVAGIQFWIRENQHVTRKQRKALENIQGAAQRAMVQSYYDDYDSYWDFKD